MLDVDKDNIELKQSEWQSTKKHVRCTEVAADGPGRSEREFTITCIKKTPLLTISLPTNIVL